MRIYNAREPESRRKQRFESLGQSSSFGLRVHDLVCGFSGHLVLDSRKLVLLKPQTPKLSLNRRPLASGCTAGAQHYGRLWMVLICLDCVRKEPC